MKNPPTKEQIEKWKRIGPGKCEYCEKDIPAFYCDTCIRYWSLKRLRWDSENNE